METRSNALTRHSLLFHLAVPAFLAWMAIDGYIGGVFGRFGAGLLTVSAVGTMLILSMWTFGRRPGVSQWIPRFHLLSLSTVGCYIAAEVAISIMVPICRFGIARFPRQPHLRIETPNNTEAIPGRTIRTVFTTNELGLRGRPLADSHGAYRVFAVGASTTENYLLDDNNAWPHLLERLLEQDRGEPAWVQNAGVSGLTAIDHLMLLRSSPVTADADVILILVGINDLSAALAFEGRSSEAGVVRRAEEQFGLFPLYSRSAVFKLAKLMTVDSSMQYSSGQDFHARRRTIRQGAPVVELPPLDLAIREYGDRLLRIADECRTRSKRCVFLTQPTLWKPEMTAAEAATLWLGWVGPLEKPVGYPSPDALARAMDQFNAAAIAIARTSGVEAYDLAADVPKSSSVFYDDCHFTNEGARIVAAHVASYLRSTPDVHQPQLP